MLSVHCKIMICNNITHNIYFTEQAKFGSYFEMTEDFIPIALVIAEILNKCVIVQDNNQFFTSPSNYNSKHFIELWNDLPNI